MVPEDEQSERGAAVARQPTLCRRHRDTRRVDLVLHLDHHLAHLGVP